MHILLIAGGWSTEREISLRGAEGMAKALQKLGHHVTIFDLVNFDNLLATAEQYDLALINLHGDPGEDGLVQAMLDQAGILYQGADARGSLIALHKAATKQIVHRHGILTPKWEFIPKPCAKDWRPKLAYPLFVKSETGGSSIHLERVENLDDLLKVMTEIFNAGCGVLIEEAITGIEVTCGILGKTALPPVMIKPKSGSFFDFHNKYADDGAEELCPAPLDATIIENIKAAALSVHNALGLDGLSRSDFILADNRLYFLEVNTLPGMTQTSLVPKEAQAIGLDFTDLMAKFVELALQKRSLHN